MTEAKRATLEALKAQRRMYAISGGDATENRRVGVLDARITEMQAEVDERVRQGRLADAQIRAGDQSSPS